jgi:hypothetical protein
MLMGDGVAIDAEANMSQEQLTALLTRAGGETVVLP